MNDTRAERQRRVQREMSDRFERSHALRNEQERIEKRMADLEQDFQDCQSRLKIVKAKITDNETFVLDENDQPQIFATRRSISKAPEGPKKTANRSQQHGTATNARPGFSPYTGRPKPTIVKKDHIYPTKGRPTLCEDYPTIVKMERGWAETWCHICGANSTKRGFLAGLLGLLLHVQVRHKQHHPRIAFKELIAVCGLHYLTDEEFAAICTREMKVNHKFEEVDMVSNEVSDEELLRRAEARLGVLAAPLENAPAVIPEELHIHEEAIVVKPRETGPTHGNLEDHAEEYANQHENENEDEWALGLKIKKEVQTDTDSTYEDDAIDQQMDVDSDGDGEIVVASSGRARKRRCLRVLSDSDDEDE